MSQEDDLKRWAAERAVADVRDGMVLGLGSGSTVAFVLEALSKLVAGGMKIAGIPSSRQTAAAAERLGVPLTDFAAHPRIDLTIDGADQVARGSLDLVKGLGGALLREKIVAQASDAMIVVVDESKLVDQLGDKTVLPVEIIRFGAELTFDRLNAIGAAPRLRQTGGVPYVTDNGNVIADCRFAAIPDPAALDAQLRAVFGVVATGLFYGLATKAIIGTANGVQVIEKPR